jgi:hypothetical protein
VGAFHGVAMALGAAFLLVLTVDGRRAARHRSTSAGPAPHPASRVGAERA